MLELTGATGKDATSGVPASDRKLSSVTAPPAASWNRGDFRLVIGAVVGASSLELSLLISVPIISSKTSRWETDRWWDCDGGGGGGGGGGGAVFGAAGD